MTRYACADGQTVTAGYPDGMTAIVTYRDHSYTLKLAHSADGARYTGYGLQWWRRGAQADLGELKAGEEVAPGPGLACRPAAATADSMTRAGFIPAK